MKLSNLKNDLIEFRELKKYFVKILRKNFNFI